MSEMLEIMWGNPRTMWELMLENVGMWKLWEIMGNVGNMWDNVGKKLEIWGP